MIKAKFDTLYQTDIFEKKKIRQNGVIGFLAFCLNAIFGNMSVHQLSSPHLTLPNNRITFQVYFEVSVLCDSPL